ncbi:hypothetical protein TWF106_001374 [Orbilia oligospora]|uniref:Uncharacterized protein n=1 Tax=Orbilia oligospora TaxID=2813651 RepID=A0A7C8UMS9_ORBOL|nr:hypothetical protein TWF106_001374 [Orbilia oligospora]
MHCCTCTKKKKNLQDGVDGRPGCVWTAQPSFSEFYADSIIRSTGQEIKSKVNHWIATGLPRRSPQWSPPFCQTDDSSLAIRDRELRVPKVLALGFLFTSLRSDSSGLGLTPPRVKDTSANGFWTWIPRTKISVIGLLPQRHCLHLAYSMQ